MASPTAAVILQIDDDSANRQSVTWLLEIEGFNCWEAATGSEGLRLAKDGPDLILVDINLPDMTGFDVCRILRADPETADIPVIEISGHYVRHEHRVQGLQQGADAYLTKPVPPDELLAHIRAMLRVHQAERLARRTARSWQTTFDAVRDGVGLLDAAGNVVRCNRAFARLFDASPDALTGHAYEALRRRGTPGEPVAELPENPGDTPRAVAEIRLGAHWFRETRDPVVDEEGRPAGAVVVWAEITQRRLLEEQLRQAQKMEAVGLLAGGIAHDFNNLLTVITGYSELLLSGMAETEPAQPLLQEIRKAGDRAAALTRQLLAFGRRQILQPVVLDLNEVVAEMERMLRRLIGEDVDLDTRLAPELDRVRVDRGQLEQVLLNLLVNARDAMPTGGKLTVETRNVVLDATYAQAHAGVEPGRHVLLAVSDTGVGMPPEVRAHIFEPFFTTKEQGKGTGLGLATVYGIVKQSKGHIQVYSEPGKGSVFKVYLPTAGWNADERQPEGSERPRRGSETVLLAEDEDGVRSLARAVLERHGYTVLEAPDGLSAARLAAEHRGPIHLLLTDVVMPHVGGRQLADALTAAWPELRVLYVSGYTDEAVVRHGVLEGSAAFLHKPFTPEALARKVRELLDAPAPRNGQGR